MTIPTRETIAKLYAATFNRAPDADGLLYWLNESGLSLEQIAQSFFDQPETQLLYPLGALTSDFVSAVYENLFNRLPDTEGLAYWVTQLENGSVSKQNFILAVINGALDTIESLDATILAHKMEVALSFVNAGLNNPILAASILSGISASSESVTAALSTLNGYLGNNETPNETPNDLPTILSDELSQLASLIQPNTYEGALSVEALRSAVLVATNSDDYFQAFDPSQYAGGEDGIFSIIELGVEHLGDIIATSENLESLFYGTIINTLKAIDATEFMQIANFTYTNRDALLSGDDTAIATYSALMLDACADIANPPFFNDAQIVGAAVESASSFVELIGTGDITSLIEGTIAGFLGN